MEFDPKIFEQIKNMDPAELNKKINEISSALGVDPRMVKMLVGNPEHLKNKLEKLSSEDIKRLSSKIDPEKLEKLKESL